MENIVKENGYWAVTANWLAMGISLIYVFLRFVPPFLNHNVPADDSWTQTLHG